MIFTSSLYHVYACTYLPCVSCIYFGVLRLQKGAIIGVDAEWRLPICNGGEERLVDVHGMTAECAIYTMY